MILSNYPNSDVHSFYKGDYVNCHYKAITPICDQITISNNSNEYVEHRLQELRQPLNDIDSILKEEKIKRMTCFIANKLAGTKYIFSSRKRLTVTRRMK